ncbi:MAG TPA: histidine kinase [Ideonella sp.]|uniref:sensor histidine kinase n=1 Tax=Ideonella sp. TaxID=1929293 RepID=UPI002E309833|nr:histidine kinase [Ideonella sp.]HEX5684837.1 histidine kinase [Ideonella sp.]
MHDTGASTLFDDLREAVTAPDLTQEALQLCRSGTLLRAMLLVIVVLGVGLLFGARGPASWLGELSAAATVAVPATLLWVLMACAARHLIARAAPLVQVAAASALGAVAALVLWWPMAAVDMAPGSTHAVAPALTGALLAALVFQSERWRQRARLPAAAAARLADLQTRIRPHFLFNTLNTAITLVQLDPKRAEEVLEDLSDLFRAALGALDQATTVGAEIELSRRYLAIEQLRFGRRLDVEWDLDANAATAKLPPLALQPLIENAVRHGIEPADKGGTIEIRTRRRRDRVLISVTNTVAAGPSRPGHGIGIASVRERLRLMHDLDADFRCGLTEDGRFRVSIGLPS